MSKRSATAASASAEPASKRQKTLAHHAEAVENAKAILASAKQAFTRERNAAVRDLKRLIKKLAKETNEMIPAPPGSFYSMVKKPTTTDEENQRIEDLLFQLAGHTKARVDPYPCNEYGDILDGYTNKYEIVYMIRNVMCKILKVWVTADATDKSVERAATLVLEAMKSIPINFWGLKKHHIKYGDVQYPCIRWNHDLPSGYGVFQLGMGIDFTTPLTEVFKPWGIYFYPASECFTSEDGNDLLLSKVMLT